MRYTGGPLGSRTPPLIAALLACVEVPVDSHPDRIPVAALASAPQARVDPLVCGVDWTAGAGRLRFDWWVDGVPFTGMRLSTEHPGDTVFAGYTRPGQTWLCRVADGKREAYTSVVVGTAALDELDPPLEPDVRVEDGKLSFRGGEDAQAVRLTWGVNGWADRFAPETATRIRYDTNEVRAESYVDMVRDGAHWVADVELPGDTRAVHAIFQVDGQIDDAEGRDYTWDLVFPSVGPYLTWNDVATPSTGMVVNWATGLPGLGVVEYGPDEENVAYAVGTEVGTVHHVVLEGLPPGRRFVYRVRDGLGRTSPWSEFQTAELDVSTFRFIVAADMQDTGLPDDRWPEVAATIRRGWDDARFVLAPGDLTADDYPGLWWLFFDGGRELFNHVPLVPAVGNHDTPGVESSADVSSWRHWFALPETPGSEAYWRLDYGRLRVLSVNSEVATELAPGGAQHEWIEAEMGDLWDGDDRTVDWALASFHVPAYNAGARFADVAVDQRPITDLFVGNVDVVITGHEHIYQRFAPLGIDGEIASSGEYGLGADEGTLHLVAPSAGFGVLDTLMVGADEDGGEQRELLAWPELAEEQEQIEAIHGFLVGDVSPAALDLSFVGMGDTEAPASPAIADTVTVLR